MQQNFKKYYNPEDFREQGHKLVDHLADYLHACLDLEDFPVLPWKDPEEQYQYWKEYFEDDKVKNPEHFYTDVLKQSIHLHHPRYIGHQVVPPLPQAALTELLEAFSNNSMAVYEMGPAATAIERVLIEWMALQFGWGKESGGFITSGGSLGNLTALLTARQNHPKAKLPSEKLAMMLSSESHYSNERAGKIMGLSPGNIMFLPVKKHRILVDKLPSLLKQADSEGKSVFALTANACSTSTGIYDPLDEIAAFCKENNIWMHVDAAHGGPAIFSKKYRYLLQGIERADSIVIDFHKMMLTPALTTAVLFKDGKTPYKTFQQQAAYLLSREKEWFDIAKRSIECTKKPMALKVFMMIKTYGKELFKEYIEYTYDLAREFADMIKNNKNFELATEPESNIVCFRLIDQGKCDDKLNSLNSKLREQIVRSGKFYIVQTDIGGKIYLRITIMNPFTNKKSLLLLLAVLQDASEVSLK